VGAALKSYGGSKAYAEKISLRAKAFAPEFGSGAAADTDADAQTAGD
jgi:hypothetical protein